MKGKASEIPVKNRFSDNEQTDAPTTVAAKPEDKPSDRTHPDTAAQTAAIAPTDTVEAPQVANSAGNHRSDADHELEDEVAELASRLPAFEPKLNTLKGNIANYILDFVKTLQKPWEKMDQYDQERTISCIGDFASSIVTASVNVVAARGFKHYDVNIGKFTVDREKESLEAKLVSRLDNELVDSMCEDTSCMIVFRNSEGFYSDAKRKLEPTTIGSLGIPVPEQKPNGITVPTSGPGTPTPPAVMDAVGKGPEAAAQAAATVAEQPAAH